MNKNRIIKYLALWIAVLGLSLAVAVPAAAKTRKGDRIYENARLAELQREYLKAYDLYQQALAEDPGDSQYQLGYERSRFRAAQEHLKEGQRLRKQGALADAVLALEKAIAVDPSLDIARQELEEVQELIKKEKARQASPDQASSEPLKTTEEIAEERRQQILDSLQAPPDLKPISRKPLNLVINNQTPKVMFETVGKLAGVNVLFDPQFLQANTSTRRDLQLVNASLEQSLDYISLLTKSFWKPVTENAIFVTGDDANKRREYADWVVKVFYLRNVNGAQELTEIANNIRQVTNSRFLFPVPSQNALVVRAERDQVLLIEKLVADLDKSKPEVVVDVMVFEASRNKTRDLVASFLSGTTNGLRIPIAFTPRNPLGSEDGDDGAVGSGAIRLNQLSRLSSADFSISLPNAVFSALMSDADARLMQSPQIRALDGAEASLKVGSQVPFAQGSFSSGIGGGVGGLPLANTQFQLIQVGTDMTLTPRVMGDNEIYLKFSITLSSVLERIDIGGVEQPVIGNRVITHEVRLRAGEVNLIGGLMTQEDTRSLAGTAGLANIPILGRLFSGESVTKRDQDVFVALIPRIVRKFQLDESNTRAISAGTDQVIKLTFSPPEAQASENGGSPAAPAAGALLGTPAATPQDGQPTQTVPSQPVPVTLPPTEEESAAAPDSSSTEVSSRGARGVSSRGTGNERVGRGIVSPQAEGTKIAGQDVGLPEVARMAQRGSSPATIRFNPPGMVVAAGSTFTLVLDTQQMQDFHDVTFRLEFDPKVLQLKEVRQGSLLTAGGKSFGLETKPDNADGSAEVRISLPAGEEGVTANGSLAVFQLEAVGSGAANVMVSDLAPKNSAGAVIVQTTPTASIRVQ